jgi:hypothetical protein
MVEKKYFNLIMDAKDKIGGTLYAPKETDTLLIKDAKEVIGWRNLVFTLKNGIYTPYHMANIGCNLLSDEFKDTIEEFIPNDYPVEFLPVKVQSEEYGEKQYYIMHFKIIFDVIDPKNTIYVPETKSIIKLCLDKEKVKDLDIFNSQPAINDIIVSDNLRKAIKKNKLDFGIEFSQLRCI